MFNVFAQNSQAMGDLLFMPIMCGVIVFIVWVCGGFKEDKPK